MSIRPATVAAALGGLLALAGLGGCQQVAQFTAADAAMAQRMALQAAPTDPQAAGRAQCWGGWAGLATGLSAQSQQPGIFTGVETGIEIQSLLQAPTCQVIAGQVMMWAVRHAPGGNFLP